MGHRPWYTTTQGESANVGHAQVWVIPGLKKSPPVFLMAKEARGKGQHDRKEERVEQVALKGYVTKLLKRIFSRGVKSNTVLSGKLSKPFNVTSPSEHP